MDTKDLTVRKFGWKRIARNTQKFGWSLEDAVQHEETTYNTNYEGHVVGDEIHIRERTTSSTKIRINLFFTRNPNDFENLQSIFFLEALYTIAYIIRKLLGYIVPLAIVLFVLCFGTGYSNVMYPDPMQNPVVPVISMIFFPWLTLIIVENILASFAARILRRR